MGRTTEQIHAYNTGTPTWDDMDRWARLNATSITERNLPDTGIPITEWTALLDQAQTPAEFYVIADAVLGDGPDAVRSTLDDFLEAAADWCDAHDQPDTAQGCREAARYLGTLSGKIGGTLDHCLDTAYWQEDKAQQARAGKSPAPSTVPAPPTPPGGKGPTR